ncbi:uncharacterized protein LOC124681768 [Lolium rigidum]|uniref:uncharacterized protein LOC124681768 n=1 Tax=Lolium rigidum TaxID=89674 RepID=UPI001F5D3691|nr:uncharacterized protein LOC124681768 [Lolium rigidum]XP_047072550.1 uncharacterized protein LOC124681768 [Lolium rigidum]XP_051177225.1 uncharacterized protein LOC127291943 [Lolium perenne]XP_051177226.1 uncharacterized protein LOC127291943 [Lolium perenne]XP_051177227.1 uncharacterized protein LOC127291943 [Lolium perenne]
MRRPREPCPPWSDGLPPELLDIILRYLTCLADRVYFAAVCRAWRSAAQVHKGTPCQVPCLLLPSPVAPSFLSLQSGATRRLYLPEGVRAARLCGSHEDGWVALALDQWRGYAALNLRSGAMVPLPDRLRIPSEHGWIDTTCEHPMVIRTVTFSGTPSTDGSLAAAHVSSASNIAFWRTGMDRYWIACRRNVDVIEDIIYYKEGFYVLSNTEDIVVYTPNIVDGDDPLVMSSTSYLVQKRADYKPDSRLPKGVSMSRYLVESRGKLLMILRHFKHKQRREFRIFEMNLAVGGGGSEASWVELHALPGRMLLLGRGCSRAFEVSQFDTLPVGNIYYLNDTSFNLSLASSNGSWYPRTNMSVYDFHKPRNKTRRYPRKFTSECSVPIWFIP